ncbi:MAG: hypothetical protein L6R28_01740 [Planctomycetes bacterium]|nr:hypothetical protein [Planctomycetota bacterium]
MNDFTGDLVRLEIKLAEHVRKLGPRLLEAPKGSAGSLNSGDFGHFNYKLPSYLLAHLYQLDHPANTLKGQAWCADLAIGLVDYWVDDLVLTKQKGERTNTSEWPIYAAQAVMNFLGPLVDDKRKARWRGFVENYIEYALQKPFGFTAPNHEAWRSLALYYAGQNFDRPEWCETALFFVRQFAEFQTEEGFWEEGRHHGPSMRYNNVCLAGLAMLYRHSGDETVGAAAKRLATFMSTYTHPDATTVGAFDGRQSTSLAYYAPVAPGFDLVPTGRTLNARGIELWHKIGRFENVKYFSNSLWYGMFSSMFYGAACHYYTQMIPESERAASIADGKDLPVDRDGTVERHSATFDGLVHRKSAWSVALSSQNSDVPIQNASVYRLDRQSRIELWNAKTGLLVGGGHNRKDAEIPYANVVMDTGFSGPAEYGVVQNQEGGENDARRRYFIPRWTRSRVVDGKPELEVIFAHGTVRFRIEVAAANRAVIDASWNVRMLDRLNIQLPLVVWRGATLSADGQAQTGGEAQSVAVAKKLCAEGGPYGSRVTLTVPKGADAKVHYPLPLLRDYGGTSSGEDEMVPPFEIALLSCQWTKFANEGSARFELSF